MKGTSTRQKRGEVHARFHLVQKLFRFSPFFTRGLMILALFGSALVPQESLASSFAAYVQKARFAKNGLAFLASLSRYVAGRCRSAVRHGASAARPLFAGGHATDLSARDSSGATPSG